MDARDKLKLHSQTYIINEFNMKKFFVLCFAPLMFLYLTNPAKALAATYTVTKTANADDGTCDADCSIREAIAASNSNSGNDTISFAIPESDGGYIAPSGSVQGYFVLPLTSTLTLSDDSGVYINGYSQSGASRNTAAFGETIDTILKIQLSVTTLPTPVLSVTSDNNHIVGINFAYLSQNVFSITGSSSNWIEGNFFASTIDGFTSPTNIGSANQILSGSSDNIIGTNGDGSGDVGERNLFMGTSGQYKVTIGSGNTNDNVISGNYFGVDKTGRNCETKSQGRAMVSVFSGTGNQVGTNLDGISDSEEANIMACVNTNARGEIQLGGGATLTTVQGNFIGTNPQGDDLLSSFAEPGIRDNGTGSYNTIKKNIIKYNGSGGVVFLTDTSVGNTISENTILNNTGLGIDLAGDGLTPNDVGDTDAGENDLMNFPVIDRAWMSEDGESVIVKVDLDFNSSEAPYTIELFDNDSVDATGYGEGQYFIGSVSTSEIGEDIELTIPITGVTPSSFSTITSTATNTNGSTSEFSTIPSDTAFSTLDQFSPNGGKIAINSPEEKASGSTPNYTSTRAVTIYLKASDSLSGVTQMKISENKNFKNTRWRDYKNEIDNNLSEGDGTKTVYVKFKDESGRVSKTYSQKITLDTSLPTFTLTNLGTLTKDTGLYIKGKLYNLYYYSDTYVSFGGTLSDLKHGESLVLKYGDTTHEGNEDEVSPIYLNYEDAIWRTEPLHFGVGVHTISIYSIDKAGNESDHIEFKLMIDPNL